jgi:hypothetical protein
VPRIFLLHSPAQRALAASLAARLDLTVEVEVDLLEAASGETVLDSWDNGLDSSAILLLLDPAIVPDPPTRDVWAPILDHIEHRAAPPIAPILAAPCRYPKLLERPPFFQAADPRPLVEWLHGVHAGWLAPSFIPAPLPHFTGFESQRETLWRELADAVGVVSISGPKDSGKTTLAHAFAREAAGHFRAIVWVPCGGRPAQVITGELARQLGVPAHTSAGELRPQLEAVLAERRLLAVLDDLSGPAPVDLPPGARSSLIITTREPHPGLILDQRPPLPQPDIQPEDQSALSLLAQCGRNAAPTAIVPADSIQRLIDARALDPHDAARHAVRVLVPPHTPTVEHAQAVHRSLAAYRSDPLTCAWSLPEARTALETALSHDLELAAALAERAARFCEQLDRIPEAAHFYQRFIEHAPSHAAAEHLSGRLAWIAGEDGRLHAPAAPGAQLSLFG